MAGQRIARVAKADKGRTMMHADVANEVIDAVNEHDVVTKALQAATVSPAGAGEFILADANMVLKLHPSALGAGAALPVYPEDDGTYVLGVVIADAVPTLQWLPTSTCA